MTRSGNGPTPHGTLGDVDTQQSLPQLIRGRREELGLSLRRLGQLSGVSYSTIANIELGKTRHPGDDILRGLALGLDKPLSELRRAADLPPAATEFRLPPKAKNLTQKQRRAILAMVEAFLETDTPDV